MIRPSLTARARSRPVLATAAAGAALAGAAYLLSRRNGARAANGALVLEDAGEAVLDLPASGITIASGEDDLMGSEAMTTDTMGDGTLDDGAPGDEPMDDGALDAGAAAEDGGISNGLNARPLDDTISQSAPGIPDDSGRPVEIAPEEEARLAERIRSM
jgi:hypothetical protein